MTFKFSASFLFWAAVVLFAQRAGAQNAKLDLRFFVKEEVKGSLFIGIYDSEQTFMSAPKAKFKRIIVVDKSEMQISITDLPPGTYALSCFQDMNDNKKLDKNMVGIPSEPYGFSNNARPSFRAPRWDECTFYLPENGKQIDVNVEDWW